MAQVILKSDGTPHNTHLLIDGKEVECTAIKVEFHTNELAKVTVELYVDQVDLEGECALHTSAVFKIYRCKGDHTAGLCADPDCAFKR